jgi:ABC-type glycerol-3-phosphate transport system permease component
MKYKFKIKWSAIPGKIIVYLSLFFFVFISLMPVYLIWSSSLKTNTELAENGPMAFPKVFHWENFVEAWNTANFGTYAKNSIIISITTTAIVVVISLMAGYALSLLPLPGKKGMTLFMMLAMAIPYQGLLLPIYQVITKIKLGNTLLGVILVLSGLYVSFGTYLLRSFFAGISREIAEAARMDGCNEWQVLWLVMAPIAAPAVATLIVFISMWSWSELLVPLVFLQNDSIRTLSVGVTFFVGRWSTNYILQAAGATMLSIPAILTYITFQRQFISGVSAGSLTGL